MLACVVAAGVIVFGGMCVYVIWKACDKIPPPPPKPPGTNTNDHVSITIQCAPSEGHGFARAALLSYDGSSTFVLSVLKADNPLFELPTVYYLTGHITGSSASVTAYDTNGSAVSTATWQIQYESQPTNSP